MRLYIATNIAIEKYTLDSDDGKIAKNESKRIYINNDAWIDALAVDPENDFLYLFDYMSEEFIRMTTNGSSPQILFTTFFGNVFGMTIDWSSDNLYWTDLEVSQIEVAKSNGDFRKVLIKFDAHSWPSGIVSDPING